MSLLVLIKERTKKVEARRQEAIIEARRLVLLLREKFTFQSLYLVGSILSSKFRLYSDIDMVIEGLKLEYFFKAHALLLKESTFDIDLKPFEDLSDDYQKKVLSGGLKIG